MLILVLGIVAALVVAGVKASDDADSEASSAETTQTTVPATTTIPRVTQVQLLQEYCNAPGLKWPEVPPHVAGEPDRTYARIMDIGLDNASDTSSSIRSPSSSTLGGSTVISPHTDNAFTDDASVLPRTRTVTCVTLVGTEAVGETCNYTQQLSFSTASAQVAQNRFAVTVYELHSGGILHKGEILTRATGCPEWAVTSEGGGLVAYGLTDQDVLSWLNSHFVDGKPA